MEKLAPTVTMSLEGSVFINDVRVGNRKNLAKYRHRRTAEEMLSEPRPEPVRDPWQKTAEGTRTRVYETFKTYGVPIGHTYYIPAMHLETVRKLLKDFKEACETFNKQALRAKSDWYIIPDIYEMPAVDSTPLRSALLQEAKDCTAKIYQFLSEGDIYATRKTIKEAQRLLPVFENGDKHSFDDALRIAANHTKHLVSAKKKGNIHAVAASLDLAALSFLEERYTEAQNTELKETSTHA